jgi:hypothetical protein
VPPCGGAISFVCGLVCGMFVGEVGLGLGEKGGLRFDFPFEG